MCRLFGLLSVNVSNARKYLLDDPCCLLVQSKADPERLQRDGWGLGFYVNGFPRLIKSAKPVYEEYEKFASTVSAANSKIMIAHIRRASNPRGIPKEKIISVENSQPFMHKNFIFAHNGVINIPDEVADSLGQWKTKVRSLNDSEVYFWYIMKEMANGANFPEAIKNFQRTLSELWQKNRDRHPGKNRPYVGLNVLFSDGERLYAYCKYDKEDENARSLCFKDQIGLQMSYTITPKSLVVASEKTNREDEWQLLKNGCLLIGQIENENVEVKIQEI